MGYGSKEDKDGNNLRVDDRMPPLVGPSVPGNKIVRFGFATDFQSGAILENQAELVFEQSNGAELKHRFYGGDEAWQVDMINRQFAHLCGKIISTEDYWKIIDGAGTFHEMVTRIENQIISLSAEKSYTLRVVFNGNKKKGKYYAGLPKWGNFIELDGTIPTTLAQKAGDLYEMPATAPIEDIGNKPTQGSDAAKGTESNKF